MSDKFADLEEPKSLKFMFVLIAIGLYGIFLAFRWSTSTYEPVQGVVETVGATAVAKMYGATVEIASVRLSDGTLVLAQVAHGGPLSVGDEVQVVKQPTSDLGPSYQVIAKSRRSEP